MPTLTGISVNNNTFGGNVHEVVAELMNFGQPSMDAMPSFSGSSIRESA